MNAEQKLRNAFVTAFHLPSGADIGTAEQGQTDGWDSVAHLALVTQIEEVFGVSLDPDEIIALNSYAKAKEILGVHGVAVD